MKAVDHELFHSMELDALYDELDAQAGEAARLHAASCAACSARFERLRAARLRGLSALAEAVPEDFESRVMAAVDAALARRTGGEVVAITTAASERTVGDRAALPVSAGAKVIPFFARPSFAVAATLILVLGAATMLMQTRMARDAAPMAMSEATPTVPAASAYAAAAPVAEQTVATATPTLEEPLAMDGTDQAKGAQARSSPVVGARAAGAAPPIPPAAGPSLRGDQAGDPAFMAARSLYDAGRYAEALPRFDALKAKNPTADLYAARCIVKTRGCGAGAPALDGVAQRHRGSETGSRAQIEAAKCYEQIGQAQAARARYQAAKREGILTGEATRDLEGLDQNPPAAAPAATTAPGTPARSKATKAEAVE